MTIDEYCNVAEFLCQLLGRQQLSIELQIKMARQQGIPEADLPTKADVDKAVDAYRRLLWPGWHDHDQTPPAQEGKKES